MKQFLDQEQIQCLIDLGADLNGSLHVLCRWAGVVSRSGMADSLSDYVICPTLTIGELIERLPEFVNFNHNLMGGSLYQRIIVSNGVLYTQLHRVVGSIAAMDCTKHGELIDNLLDCYVGLLNYGLTGGEL